MSDNEDISKVLSFFSVPKYKCSFEGCDLEFKRKDRLDSHEYIHSKVKKFKCPEENCCKAYINNHHLLRHKRIAHSTTKQIVQCIDETCANYFESVAKMNVHFNRMHSNDECHFECDICHERFRRKKQIKVHIIEIHAGHKDYVCHCGAEFLTYSHLVRHKKSHQLRHCEICTATFDKWSLLVAHKRNEHSNSANKCSICDKEFHSKRGLKIHQKTHTNTNERNVYQCEFNTCTKFFLDRRNMLAHFKLKHQNQQFECPMENCKRKLCTKQKLAQHMQAIHLNKKERKVTKINKKTRKDKGVQKISTASKLFNMILPKEMEQAIMAGQGSNIHLTYDLNTQSDDEQHINLSVSQITRTHANPMKC